MSHRRNALFVLLLLSTALSSISAVDLMRYLDRPDHMYSTPEISPVGWSADGNFAFSSERALAGIGGARMEFTIVSAVTDEVLFYRRVDLVFDPGVDSEREIEAARVEWRAALRQWQIEEGAGTEFRSLPIDLNGVVYSAVVNAVLETEELLPMDRVKSYDVVVGAEGFGKKRITGSSDVMANDMWVAGCFVSPFEQRMLVVIARDQYVFEGTEAFYLFSGAHLVHGYR